ncbi:hypothetical protein M5D96_002274, partial [Drosophila gunungcola]
MRTPFANFDFNFSPGCKCKCNWPPSGIRILTLVSPSCPAATCPALLVIIRVHVHGIHAHQHVLSEALEPRGESSIDPPEGSVQQFRWAPHRFVCIR